MPAWIIAIISLISNIISLISSIKNGTSAVSGIVSLLIAVLIFEHDRFSLPILLSHYKAFLYMGIGSCGIAYTFQIIGQKGTNPTAASLIMSLEACFSLIFGMIFHGEHLLTREWIGIALMVVAIALTETKELLIQAPKTKKEPDEDA